MVTRKSEQITEVRHEMRGGSGDVVLRALAGALPENVRLFSALTLHPGASIGEHVHENECELFYFIKGAGTYIDDGVKTTVEAGDATATLPGHSHSIVNTGPEDMLILAAIIKS